MRRGEVKVLVGPSGSGKSTLIRTVTRLEKVQGGRVLIDGADVSARSLNINRLRQRVGFVFQAYNLFPHLSALGNITLGLTKLRGMSRGAARERAFEEPPESDLPRKPTRCLACSLGARSSAWQLRAHWRWIRRSCCSMSQPRR